MRAVQCQVTDDAGRAFVGSPASFPTTSLGSQASSQSARCGSHRLLPRPRGVTRRTDGDQGQEHVPCLAAEQHWGLQTP